MSESVVNAGIYITYALIGIAIVGILFFSIANLGKSKGGAKGILIGIIGLVAVFGIAYAISTGADATTLFEKHDITEATSRRVGMGLFAFYILSAAAILSILYVEVTRLFK